MDVQHAMNYIGDLYNYLVDQFLAEWDHIPVFGGPVDLEVKAYCNMLGEWVRGNEAWSFEVGTTFFVSRYFSTSSRADGISERKVPKYRAPGSFV